MEGQRFPVEHCISGWAMQHREPAVVEDVYDDPRIPQDLYRPTFVRSLVVVPIGARELCERDPLTGVLNRRALDQLLAGALRKGTRPLYVALIDHFKDYDDRHGHPAGNALLRRAATAWRSTIRANDVLARYGGEEFAVLLAGGEEEIALEIAERLRLATIDEQRVSIGIARWDGRQTAARLVERADQALYEAKRAGRNRIALAS